MFKKPCFETPFDSQHVKENKKLHGSTFIILFHHFGIIELEDVCLSLSEIPGVFADILTADDK